MPGRLVIVSNRIVDPRRNRKAGGLAVAIGDTIVASGGVWFGWSGKISDGPDAGGPATRRSGGIDLVTLDLTPQERDGYYHGFANQCLWPLLHYRTDLVRFDRGFLLTYSAVNRRFAEALARLLRPDDVVWVHDFHLLPLGAELRRLGCRQPLGFFLHVPFPPTEVVATLPGHRALLGELMSYDLLGFQTENDTACFRAYASRELRAEALPAGRLRSAGRETVARAFPVGIDVEAFAALSRSAETSSQVEDLKRSLGERQLIVGVDRLDYSKGLPQRFSAYRRFLETSPEYRNRVVLMQVCPPSREELPSYVDIRRELDRLEGAIHGQFAEFDWTPMRYIRRAVPREKLAALYRASRVGLVTPLRDGMNLVAKEYVAAQDPDDPGVLALSCFAGAAETMDRALIVNPYDVDEVAAALGDALRMPLAERQERHAALLATIKKSSADAWQRSFLETLTGPQAEAQVPPAAFALERSIEPAALRPVFGNLAPGSSH
jgi:trehalose 6-phosphate synthase